MKKIKWTLERIKEGFELFYKQNKHYPTASEIDCFVGLPSSRQIQRTFGGLPAIRQKLNLKGPSDFTKGEHSSNRAHMIGERAHKVENEVYTYLKGHFGEPFVHREYFFTDDKRNRTDFYIYYSGGNFSVDVFYPNDKRSLSGCLNSKLRNYSANYPIKYPVIFLMMNENIGDDDVKTILNRKVNKLRPYQILMTYNQFKKFCENKRELST